MLRYNTCSIINTMSLTKSNINRCANQYDLFLYYLKRFRLGVVVTFFIELLWKVVRVGQVYPSDLVCKYVHQNLRMCSCTKGLQLKYNTPAWLVSGTLRPQSNSGSWLRIQHAFQKLNAHGFWAILTLQLQDGATNCFYVGISNCF